MRLKVGFSFPPVILAYALQCKRLSGLPNLHATAHAKDIWENRSSWQPKRYTADKIVCRVPQLTSCLSVAPERQGVLLLPGLPAAGRGVVVLVATVDTTGLLAGGGETASLTVLVHGVDDPVDAGVTADGLVLGVDEDDLVVLVGAVLVDPVGVEDAEVGAAAADTLLSGGLEGTLVLELVDTLVGGLACFAWSAPLFWPVVYRIPCLP